MTIGPVSEVFSMAEASYRRDRLRTAFPHRAWRLPTWPRRAGARRRTAGSLPAGARPAGAAR